MIIVEDKTEGQIDRERREAFDFMTFSHYAINHKVLLQRLTLQVWYGTLNGESIGLFCKKKSSILAGTSLPIQTTTEATPEQMTINFIIGSVCRNARNRRVSA